MKGVCQRCGATLRDASRSCGVCRADRVEAHVRTLVASAGSFSTPALKAKADAVVSLRSLGFSQQEVIEVRAQALDGWSVAKILEGLAESEAVPA
jgi:hypothetical protein